MVLATKKYFGTNPQSTGPVFPLKKFYQCFSACVGATDVWSRSSFWVTTCMFFSAHVGKIIDCVLTTRPLHLQTVMCNQTCFVANGNGSESFRVHCFACWTSLAVILFSGSFHLLQDPGYRVRVWSLASRTKCSVSAGTWYRWLYFLPVQGKHLPVKTSICRSSGGSVCTGMNKVYCYCCYRYCYSFGNVVQPTLIFSRILILAAYFEQIMACND